MTEDMRRDPGGAGEFPGPCGYEAAVRTLAADLEEDREVHEETMDRMLVHDRLLMEILFGTPGDGSWRRALEDPGLPGFPGRPDARKGGADAT